MRRYFNKQRLILKGKMSLSHFYTVTFLKAKPVQNFPFTQDTPTVARTSRISEAIFKAVPEVSTFSCGTFLSLLSV